MLARSQPAAGETASAPARTAVITMVRDEGQMLPRWVDYYGRQVGVSNLVVLDDNSVDGSADDLPCTVYRLPPPPWKRPWSKTRLGLANGIARGLLACYDVVVFTDVDEFIVADPEKYDGLVDYLSANAGTRVIAPLALELLHNVEVEAVLDPTRPLLQQRRFVKFSPGMCKPLVKRVGQPWNGAFHRISAPFEVDRDLWMLHLKYSDVEVLETVAEHRRRIHQQENRGHPDSFWPMGADKLKALLSSWASSTGPVPEFDSAEPDLRDLVQEFGDGTWAVMANQVRSLEESPLRQLPPRFRELF